MQILHFDLFWTLNLHFYNVKNGEGRVKNIGPTFEFACPILRPPNEVTQRRRILVAASTYTLSSPNNELKRG